MTTTEVAVIEPEAAQQLTEKQARALDKRIRAASDKLSTNTEALLDLLEAAVTGNIHEALDYPSWTAYVKDAVQITVSDRWERKALVSLMSGKGMSQRAIAGTLGVSQKTVDRDLEGTETDDSATVTGLDGVEQPRNKSKPDVIDAEVVDEEPAVDMKAADIAREFDDEAANLSNAVNAMLDLTEESLWDKATKRIAAAELNTLQENIVSLQSLVDALMGR